MKRLKIIVQKYADGYVAYPLDLRGAVVGEGNTFAEALADIQSALKFHFETFGVDALDKDEDVLEAFVAEVSI